MADVKTDEEQVEAIKRWFDENGTSMIVTLVVVLAVVFGYRSWESQKVETAETASAKYEALVEAVRVANPNQGLSEENISTGKFLAGQLKDDHADSTYAHFAAMHLAKLAVDAGDLENAATELQWVLDNDASEKIAVIANLRLAKIKLAMGDNEAALAQLGKVQAGAHQSSYDELKGDALYALERKDEAREAYQNAATIADETGGSRPAQGRDCR